MIFNSGFGSFGSTLVLSRVEEYPNPATEERIDPVKAAPKGLKPMVQWKQAKQTALDRFLLKQKLRRL